MVCGEALDEGPAEKPTSKEPAPDLSKIGGAPQTTPPSTPAPQPPLAAEPTSPAPQPPPPAPPAAPSPPLAAPPPAADLTASAAAADPLGGLPPLPSLAPLGSDLGAALSAGAAPSPPPPAAATADAATFDIDFDAGPIPSAPPAEDAALATSALAPGAPELLNDPFASPTEPESALAPPPAAVEPAAPPSLSGAAGGLTLEGLDGQATAPTGDAAESADAFDISLDDALPPLPALDGSPASAMATPPPAAEAPAQAAMGSGDIGDASTSWGDLLGGNLEGGTAATPPMAFPDPPAAAFEPPPPQPEAPAPPQSEAPAPPPPEATVSPQAPVPNAELDQLSRLSGTEAAGALAKIAAQLEAQGNITDAVRVWRAAQLLDPMSGVAAEALVRLVG